MAEGGEEGGEEGGAKPKKRTTRWVCSRLVAAAVLVGRLRWQRWPAVGV